MKKLQSIIICSFVLANSFSVQAQYAWTQKDSLKAYNGRGGAACFSIGHYGYIGTGQTSSGYVSDFWRWNQDSNTWTAIASYPGAGKWAVTAFAIGGNGYCCLGYTGSGQANDLWEYDTASNTWTQKASFPGTARYGAFAFVIGTKAYIGCGEPNGSPYFKDVWEYNATANTWTQVADFGGGDRNGLCAFTLNGYGYAGCGGNDVTDFNDMWKYDTSANTWTQVASLPVSGSEVNAPVSFVLDTLAYVGTGNNLSGQYYRDFWSYSSTTNTWTPIATLTGISRSIAVGFSIGNKGYVGTGQDSVGGYLSDFWQYGPTSTAGINELKVSNANVTVYPNPTKGLVNFTYSNLSSMNTHLIITDVLGKTISEYTFQGNQGSFSMDESSLSSGVYFYCINSNGVSISSGKFVIEK